ncbi:MAG: hypothetical protein BWY76_01953 [bacterium ADurb.Bin429]|nr:MAG: hypothetical protein BWY76_01953 [bacterium ADurb.Bin429]
MLGLIIRMPDIFLPLELALSAEVVNQYTIDEIQSVINGDIPPIIGVGNVNYFHITADRTIMRDYVATNTHYVELPTKDFLEL